jgi:transposase InsO family protein
MVYTRGEKMPIRSKSAFEQRVEFIHEWSKGEESLSGLCRQYQISRPTAYEWIARYEAEGVHGLEERSHAAKRHPNALSERIEELILRARGRHPTWGPKKLVAWISEREGLERVCAVSTAGEVLRRHGLLHPRKLHRKAAASLEPLAPYDGANAIWCVDFKGWFRLGNGGRCDPLTITDGFSRYLLRCQAFGRIELESTWRIFEAAFREYGLPARIRSDNGAPFASIAIGGLSALAVWWMKLGIIPERIAPGRPDQNGRHERMHKTLNEALEPPGHDLRAQQQRFDRFRRCYNQERPHEALELRTPASVYTASARAYPGRVPEPVYDSNTVVRKVQRRGEFNWKNQEVFLSETLRGENIGLRASADGKWEVRFCHKILGTMDERTLKITPIDPPHRRRKKSRT